MSHLVENHIRGLLADCPRGLRLDRTFGCRERYGDRRCVAQVKSARQDPALPINREWQEFAPAVANDSPLEIKSGRRRNIYKHDLILN